MAHEEAAGRDWQIPDDEMLRLADNIGHREASDSKNTTPSTTQKEIISDEDRKRMVREAEILANEEAERGAELPED